MELICLKVGIIGTNCYLVYDSTTREGAVIDPGDRAKLILSSANAEGLNLRYVLMTHGHFDHTTAVPQLLAALPDAAFYIHAADTTAVKPTSRFQMKLEAFPELNFYEEGSRLPLGCEVLEVLHTPGHSPGSVSLRICDLLFTGDTLFKGSCGRTDLEGSSKAELYASLQRLGKIRENLRVYPGHGDSSTLEEERASNDFLRSALGI